MYAYFPKTNAGSTTTHFTVFDGRVSKEIVIHKKDVLVEGQTSGEWIFSGKYILPKGEKASVTISTQNADGLIVADAVLFVPSEE